MTPLSAFLARTFGGVLRPILRAEDLVQNAIARRLRRLGRPVEVRPFPGFGTGAWARVGGRVIVGPANAESVSAQGSNTWRAVRANLAQFVTYEVPYAHVRVQIGTRSQVVSANREGYIDVV